MECPAGFALRGIFRGGRACGGCPRTGRPSPSPRRARLPDTASVWYAWVSTLRVPRGSAAFMDGFPNSLTPKLAAAGCRRPDQAAKNIGLLASDPGSRSSLELILPTLLSALGRLPDPDLALNNLERFAQKVLDRRFLLGLFRDNPRILHLALTIFGSSQFLSDILVRQPQLFEWLLEPGVVHRPKSKEELTEEARHAVAGASTLERAVDRPPPIQVPRDPAHRSAGPGGAPEPRRDHRRTVQSGRRVAGDGVSVVPGRAGPTARRARSRRRGGAGPRVPIRDPRHGETGGAGAELQLGHRPDLRLRRGGRNRGDGRGGRGPPDQPGVLPEAGRDAGQGHERGLRRRAPLPRGSPVAPGRPVRGDRLVAPELRDLLRIVGPDLGAAGPDQGATGGGRSHAGGDVPADDDPLRLPAIAGPDRAGRDPRHEGSDQPQRGAGCASAAEREAGVRRDPRDRIPGAGDPASPRWQESLAPGGQHAPRPAPAGGAGSAGRPGLRGAGAGLHLPAPARTPAPDPPRPADPHPARRSSGDPEPGAPDGVSAARASRCGDGAAGGLPAPHGGGARALRQLPPGGPRLGGWRDRGVVRRTAALLHLGPSRGAGARPPGARSGSRTSSGRCGTCSSCERGNRPRATRPRSGAPWGSWRDRSSWRSPRYRTPIWP